MAKKISELTTIASVDDSDLLPIVDVSANTTNKVTIDGLNNTLGIGDFTQLETSTQSSIVDAINVLAQGEIVERSLGGNGYIKYSNGFMLQWQSKNVTTSVAQWVSPIYYYDVTMSNWDRPFTTLFGVLCANSNIQFWTAIGGYSTTSAGTIRVFRPTNTNQTILVTAFAFGLWK